MINSRLFKLSAFALLLLACTENYNAPPEIPNTILPAATFEKILADFALAESASNMNIKNVPVNKLDTTYAFDPLEENNVRKSLYDSTIQFYAQHPELYKKIYENVLTLLSEMQARRDSLSMDSIAK